MQEQKNLPVPRIESLAVKNYRSLKSVEFRGLTPFSVFIGENGSGKSTLLDVFAFLAECVGQGIKAAVLRRGGMSTLRTYDETGPVEIAVRYRERQDAPATIYHLAIDEGPNGLYVAEEWLQWKRGLTGNVCRFLEFKNGKGCVIGGISPHEYDQPNNKILEHPTSLAVNLFGQFSQYPRVVALRRFLLNWRIQSPFGGIAEGMTVDNKEAENILRQMQANQSENLQQVVAFLYANGFLGRAVEGKELYEKIITGMPLSDGIHALLSRLLFLHQSKTTQLFAFEQDENHLSPFLLTKWLVECRKALELTQLLAVTYSPVFLDAMKPEEVWMLSHDSFGHTQVQRVSDMPGIRQRTEQGALLGHLWTAGYLSQPSI